MFRTAEDQGEGGGGGKAFVLSFLEFWVDFVMVSLKDSGKSPMAMALRYGGFILFYFVLFCCNPLLARVHFSI